ncbi:7 transmembrane sweet-taste receptor of 3 GCPR [Nitzschia inconspicua]|uniref:7 transmembrane sweet-taste receptor of 3 GCPR n=2 Tax=Nitzschia inconspicua TaxID=303405 RepID=A0A9K3KY39_9STRA|nr:7 transmembrane sweet-taste receptor of 3 GCPR [Nitzschia inconspicua]
MPNVRRLQPQQRQGDDAETSSSQQSCDCSSTSQPQCPQEISILYQGEEIRSYLEYHAVNYQAAKPHITIQLIQIPGSFSSVSTEFSASSATFLQDQSAYDWDGSIFPAHLIGVLSESQSLADLTGYIRHQELDFNGGTVDWTSILPFQRYQQSTYDSQILTIPLDEDLLMLYYRQDLFQQHNMTVPRTWEEYQSAADYFHNKPWGGPNADQPLVGSCVSRRPDCANAYWASMILSSMTQSRGTSSGYLLDPETIEPLLGPAMEETLRLLGEQMRVGPIEEELQGDCMLVNIEKFNQGLCAMTYNFGNQLVLATTSSDPFQIGVAPTPGSSKILNRVTGELEECTAESCPYGTYYEDIEVIVNQPSYSAFGGMVAGVSNTTSSGKQRAVADFFSYMSNPMQSLPDVLPNQLSSFADPYRYSHVFPLNWVDANGFFDDTTATKYTDSIRRVNSGNSVLEFRTSPGVTLRSIMDEEVSEYLSRMRDGGNGGVGLRKDVTENIDSRMQQAIAGVTTMNVTEAYQKSLGYSSDIVEVNMNYIDPDFRAAGWGLAGLICFSSFLLITWAFWHKRNRVMRAFQPFLLIQCAIGLFFLGATIFPLGFDDSLFDDSVLDITCAAIPWIYISGFSLFFSSVYSKIQMCVKIFKDPDKYDVLVVRQSDSLKVFLRVFLLNGILLALWTALDPLRWTRQAVSGGEIMIDGTIESFGACRGESMTSLGFAAALFFLNLTFCLFGTLEAFKCRFLVLEFNEIQWLPLSLLPFFEAWIIGGPLLVFMNENPTVTFVVLTLIIVASSLTAALAVFAPKDWYIRRNQGKDQVELRPSNNRTSHAGVLVLNHPTVESRRQVAKLQKQLEQINAYNTELTVDIRLMKDKFLQMTEREMIATNARLAMGEASQTIDSSRQPSSSEYEQADRTIGGNESGLVAMEHFASVWSTHDDDDLADTISEPIEEVEEAEVANPVNASSMRSSVRSGTVGSLDNDSAEELPQSNLGGIVAGIAAGGTALLGGFVYARKSSRMVIEALSKDEEDAEFSEMEQADMGTTNNFHEGCGHDFGTHPKAPNSLQGDSSSSYPPEALPAEKVLADSCRSFAEESTGRGLTDDIYALDKTIESEDLVALEAEASMLAEQFKMTSMLLESASDLQKNIDERLDNLDISKITTITGEFEDPNVTIDNSMFGSPQRSVNKSTASTEIMNGNDSPTAMPSAGESSGGATTVASRNLETIEFRSMQNAGEPSGYRRSPTPTNEGFAYDDDQHHFRPQIPLQYQSPRKPVARSLSGQRSSFSSSSQAQDSSVGRLSQKSISYTIADWSAVGMTGGILADLSDSTSTSSYAESYVDSDFGDTLRSSDRDIVGLTKEIDQMVAYADFDAVKAAAKAYDESSVDKEENSEFDRLAKIRERKEKKRELEAWRISLSRSFEKEG